PGLRDVPCTPQGGGAPSDHCSSITVTATAMRCCCGHAKLPSGMFNSISELTALLGPDVCIANNAAEVFVLFTNVRGEISATCSHRIEFLANKLRLDVACLQRVGEPFSELSDRTFRRVGRRKRPEPRVNCKILVARLSDRRNIRQRFCPTWCRNGKGS